MSRTLLTRRTVLPPAPPPPRSQRPSCAAPHAAGKLSFGVWDHWVPGAAKP